MASSRYRRLKVKYVNDFGIESIKTQKIAIVNEVEVTPITATFSNNIVNIPEKILNNTEGLRRIEAHDNNNKVEVLIVNNASSPLLKTQLEEINNFNSLDCIKYIGENRLNNVNS